MLPSVAKPDSSFANTRTRFQRLSDLKFFYGWVVDIQHEVLTVRTACAKDLRPGQVFVFELIGTKGSRTVAGKLRDNPALHGGVPKEKGAGPEEVSLSFAPIRQVKSSDDYKSCRKSAQLLVGSVRRSSGELDVAICDVSPAGAGIMISKELKIGEKIELIVNSDDRELSLAAQVRHCSKDKKSAGMYRVGVQFIEMNRIDTAVWTRFMEAA